MATLHILNHSDRGSAALKTCLSTLSATDALLLIESGVLLAARESSLAAVPCPVFALQQDMLARNVASHCKGITITSMEEFVSLCCEFDRSVSWNRNT